MSGAAATVVARGRLRVLVRGWLHGNVVVAEDALVDSGYHTGAPELLDRLGPAVPPRVLLTHVHADHAGGVAALRAAGARWVAAHADAARLVAAGDRRGLWLDGTGQHLPPFAVDATLAHGDTVALDGRPWTVLATPGHATGGLSFFDPAEGLLITGDALWEDGFGLLDPWIDGPGVFDAAAQALDRIAETGACWVVPGHGRPFAGLAPAVQRARSRLAHLAAHPDRLRAQVLRNGLGFAHLVDPRGGRARLEALGLRLCALHGIAEDAEARATVGQILDALEAPGSPTG